MSHEPTLTPEIHNLLGDVKRRERRLRQARGAVFFLLYLCALTALGAAFDRFVPASRSTRWLVAGSAYGLGLLGLFWLWLRPALKSISYVEAAWILERNVKGLDEKVISTVELSQGGQQTDHLSARMVRELAESVSKETSHIPLDKVSSLSLVRKPLAALGAVGVLFLVLSLVPSVRLGRLSARFWFPAVRYGRIGNFELRVLNADRTRIARGDLYEFDILSTSDDVESVRIELFLPGGAERSREVARDGEGHFRYVFAETADSFSYRASAHGVSTDTLAVTVLPRPAIVQFVKLIDWPAYTGRPATCETSAAADMAALPGSKGKLVVRTNDAQEAFLLTGDRRVPLQPCPDERQGSSFAHSFEFDTPSEFRIELSSAEGIRAADPAAWSTRLLSDEPPTVEMLELSDNQALFDAGVLPFRYRATDDYGLAYVAVLYSVNGSPTREHRFAGDFPAGQKFKEESSYEWSFADLGPGDANLEFSLFAVDHSGRSSRTDTLFMSRSDRLVTAAERDLARHAAAGVEAADRIGQDIQRLSELRAKLAEAPPVMLRDLQKEENFLDTRIAEDFDRLVGSLSHAEMAAQGTDRENGVRLLLGAAETAARLELPEFQFARGLRNLEPGQEDLYVQQLGRLEPAAERLRAAVSPLATDVQAAILDKELGNRLKRFDTIKAAEQQVHGPETLAKLAGQQQKLLEELAALARQAAAAAEKAGQAAGRPDYQALESHLQRLTKDQARQPAPSVSREQFEPARLLVSDHQAFRKTLKSALALDLQAIERTSMPLSQEFERLSGDIQAWREMERAIPVLAARFAKLTATRGLVLRCFDHPTGVVRADGLEALAKEFDGRKELGFGVVSQVNLKSNPFGAQQFNFLLDFEGWLTIREPGEYLFGLLVDDCAYLVIDDQVAAGAPSCKYPLEIRPGEPIHLARGRYPFRLLFSQATGDVAIAAYWRKPGQEGFELIPPAAFAPADGEPWEHSPAQKAAKDKLDTETRKAALKRVEVQAKFAGVAQSFQRESDRLKELAAQLIHPRADLNLMSGVLDAARHRVAAEPKSQAEQTWPEQCLAAVAAAEPDLAAQRRAEVDRLKLLNAADQRDRLASGEASRREAIEAADRACAALLIRNNPHRERLAKFLPGFPEQVRGVARDIAEASEHVASARRAAPAADLPYAVLESGPSAMRTSVVAHRDLESVATRLRADALGEIGKSRPDLDRAAAHSSAAIALDSVRQQELEPSIAQLAAAFNESSLASAQQAAETRGTIAQRLEKVLELNTDAQARLEQLASLLERIEKGLRGELAHTEFRAAADELRKLADADSRPFDQLQAALDAEKKLTDASSELQAAKAEPPDEAEKRLADAARKAEQAKQEILQESASTAALKDELKRRAIQQIDTDQAKLAALASETSAKIQERKAEALMRPYQPLMDKLGIDAQGEAGERRPPKQQLAETKEAVRDIPPEALTLPEDMEDADSRGAASPEETAPLAAKALQMATEATKLAEQAKDLAAREKALSATESKLQAEARKATADAMSANEQLGQALSKTLGGELSHDERTKALAEVNDAQRPLRDGETGPRQAASALREAADQYEAAAENLQPLIDKSDAANQPALQALKERVEAEARRLKAAAEKLASQSDATRNEAHDLAKANYELAQEADKLRQQAAPLAEAIDAAAPAMRTEPLKALSAALAEKSAEPSEAAPAEIAPTLNHLADRLDELAQQFAQPAQPDQALAVFDRPIEALTEALPDRPQPSGTPTAGTENQPASRQPVAADPAHQTDQTQTGQPQANQAQTGSGQTANAEGAEEGLMKAAGESAEKGERQMKTAGESAEQGDEPKTPPEQGAPQSAGQARQAPGTPSPATGARTERSARLAQDAAQLAAEAAQAQDAEQAIRDLQQQAAQAAGQSRQKLADELRKFEPQAVAALAGLPDGPEKEAARQALVNLDKAGQELRKPGDPAAQQQQAADALDDFSKAAAKSPSETQKAGEAAERASDAANALAEQADAQVEGLRDRANDIAAAKADQQRQAEALAESARQLGQQLQQPAGQPQQTQATTVAEGAQRLGEQPPQSPERSRQEGSAQSRLPLLGRQLEQDAAKLEEAMASAKPEQREQAVDDLRRHAEMASEQAASETRPEATAQEPSGPSTEPQAAAQETAASTSSTSSTRSQDAAQEGPAVAQQGQKASESGRSQESAAEPGHEAGGEPSVPATPKATTLAGSPSPAASQPGSGPRAAEGKQEPAPPDQGGPASPAPATAQSGQQPSLDAEPSSGPPSQSGTEQPGSPSKSPGAEPGQGGPGQEGSEVGESSLSPGQGQSGTGPGRGTPNRSQTQGSQASGASQTAQAGPSIGGQQPHGPGQPPSTGAGQQPQGPGQQRSSATPGAARVTPAQQRAAEAAGQQALAGLNQALDAIANGQIGQAQQALSQAAQGVQAQEQLFREMARDSVVQAGATSSGQQSQPGSQSASQPGQPGQSGQPSGQSAQASQGGLATTVGGGGGSGLRQALNGPHSERAPENVVAAETWDKAGETLQKQSTQVRGYDIPPYFRERIKGYFERIAQERRKAQEK